MLRGELFALTGVLLFGVATFGLWRSSHVLRKILALNVMGSATFLVLVGLAQRLPERIDAVPHALVLTGIVVAVSATAVALLLFRRLHALTGTTTLNEDREPPARAQDL